MKSDVLVTLFREHAEEVVVRGSLLVRSGTKDLVALGDVRQPFPARSVLKPFQYLAGFVSTYPEKVPERWVAALGSPSMIPPQTKCFERWREAESDRQRWEKAIRCAPALPIDPSYAGHVRFEGQPPQLLWNNCYTKHLAIVATCERHGWDETTYTSQEHPYHQRVVGVLGDILERAPQSFQCVVDGCTLPTPLLTLDEMGRLMTRLVTSQQQLFKIVAEAFQLYPDWIGGPGRLDTEVLRRLQTRTVAKEGADGLFAMACAPNPRFPDGLTVVSKLEGGTSAVHQRTALEPVFRALGVELGAAVVQRSPQHRAQWAYEIA